MRLPALCSERRPMAAIAGLTEVVLYDTLVNYLVSMARTVARQTLTA